MAPERRPPDPDDGPTGTRPPTAGPGGHDAPRLPAREVIGAPASMPVDQLVPHPPAVAPARRHTAPASPVDPAELVAYRLRQVGELAVGATRVVAGVVTAPLRLLSRSRGDRSAP